MPLLSPIANGAAARGIEEAIKVRRKFLNIRDFVWVTFFVDKKGSSKNNGAAVPKPKSNASDICL